MKKKKRVYEYELCITHLDPEIRGIRVRNIGLSSNASFSSEVGHDFCDLGFCNIRFKGTKDVKVALMPTLEQMLS
ncbi:MAG: hypothetical protein KAS16_02255 [Thermoplasmata archaeon]|nr:hypothetical protein [Thermoplasmata archaeon]